MSFSDFKENINGENWKQATLEMTKDQCLVNESSHFFDHIENLALKGKIVEFTYIGKLSLGRIIKDHFNRDIREDFDEKQKEVTKINIERIENGFDRVQYKPLSMRLFLFSSKIIFLEITLENNDDTKAKKYFKRLLKTKSFFKKVDIVKLLSEVTAFEEQTFEPFDKQKEGKTKKTSRFQIFSEIQLLDHNENITKEDHKYLKNYFLNRNCVENNGFDQLKDFTEEEICTGCSVSSSIEGAIVITRESISNNSILKELYSSFVQNVYFSFILTLHQFYYLNKISISVSKIDSNEMVNKDLIQTTYDLFKFKSKYMFNIVSQFSYLQDIHECFSRVYRIKQFEQEVTESIKPIRELNKERKDTSFVRTTQVFALFTTLNALLSFSTYLISNVISVFSWIYTIFLILTILLILGCVIISFFYFKHYWKEDEKVDS